MVRYFVLSKRSGASRRIVLHASAKVNLVLEVLGKREDGYHARVAETGRGQVEMRLYQAPETELGVIAVGGVGGGFDSPARGLFPG